MGGGCGVWYGWRGCSGGYIDDVRVCCDGRRLNKDDDNSELETKHLSSKEKTVYVVDPFTPRALAEPQYYIHARRVIG